MTCLRNDSGEDQWPGDFVAPDALNDVARDGAQASFVELSPDLDAAIWAEELAQGDSPPRVYVVETDGDVEDARQRGNRQ